MAPSTRLYISGVAEYGKACAVRRGSVMLPERSNTAHDRKRSEGRGAVMMCCVQEGRGISVSHLRFEREHYTTPSDIV